MTFVPDSRSVQGDAWWKHAVIYEIYPRSFGDTNGDGIGDLNGITEHLGYLSSLGIDAIWIAPMFPSPQVDFGYDISDYQRIDPQYGTMADFDRLQAEANKRHIRILIDVVLNHTSDKHRWFLESSSSRTNPKADWYVWSNGVPASAPRVTEFQRRFEHDGRVPPNNWTSQFGGSAWEWVPARKQFYYHRFYKQQPDLNWRNPAVKTAMFNMMKFWLDRGVAGFRLDAILTLFEDPQLRDDPETGGLNANGDPNLLSTYTRGLPEVHDVLRDLHTMVDTYPGNRVLIGETSLPRTADLSSWYGGVRGAELHLPMNLLIGYGPDARLSADYFRRCLSEIETELPGKQSLIAFDNHDHDRSIDRFGDGTHNEEIAKLIAAVLLTSRTTALTYYGAEIGMPSTTPARKEDVKDPVGIASWPKDKGRDGARTPMQWSAAPQAGFSSNPHTWLPVASDYRTVNVKTESADPSSLLAWYRMLIALRRSNPALHEGSLRLLATNNDASVLSYARIPADGSQAVVIAMNMSASTQTVRLSLTGTGLNAHSGQTLISSDLTCPTSVSLNGIILKPYSVWIGSL